MAGKPRVVGVVASVMEDAQQKTTRETAVISEAGVRATSHVRIAPMTGEKVESLPMGCAVPRLEGRWVVDYESGVSFFMYDAISVEMQWVEDGGQCLDPSKSFASIHFQVMGERRIKK